MAFAQNNDGQRMNKRLAEFIQHNSDCQDVSKLLLNENPETRAAVVSMPQAGRFVWTLAQDESPLVRYCVALNQNFDIQIYELLSRDSNERVARRAKRTLRNLQAIKVAADLSKLAAERYHRAG